MRGWIFTADGARISSIRESTTAPPHPIPSCTLPSTFHRQRLSPTPETYSEEQLLPAETCE